MDAPGVLDHRAAVVVDRRHGGRPPDPEEPGHRGHAAALLAHQPTDLGPGAPRERALDQGALLGEGLGLTVGVRAVPPALAPHQAHRLARDGQIPHLDVRAPVADRADPAGPTSHQVAGRLDEQPPLPGLFGHREDNEPLHPQQRGRVPTTFIHVPCPFDSWVSATARIGGHGALLVDAYGRVTVETPPHVSSRRASKRQLVPMLESHVR